MIKLEHVSKTFERDGISFKAVDDVSLEIKKGEIFGIIGFSGAGKSTLVRCINLLEIPDKGSVVSVDGLNLTALSPKDLRDARAGIGMIFQHFNLMPSRTVLENVIYPLSHKGIKKDEQRKRAFELLKRVDLESKANSYPSELSGGQKQRVAIARALASSPKVLLCDEATSALDPQTTHEILGLLKELNAELGITIVIITHEMAVVKDICSRVAVLENGHLVEQGSTFEVFANPKENITQNFVKAASNLSKAEHLSSDYPLICDLKPGEKFVRLSYRGPGVSEPLISLMTHRFNVTMNILYADVELVNNSPIGGTVGILSGRYEDVENALIYIAGKNVNVEVLKNG